MKTFQIAKVRPPTENYSLAIKTHEYCPWGKCEFCPSILFSQSNKFKRRTLKDIKKDIKSARTLYDFLATKTGFRRFAVMQMVSRYPKLKECLIHLFYWNKLSDARICFLGGANPLLYRQEFLAEILRYISELFPSVQRITSYGRTRTAAKKGVSYFKNLHIAGLDRIHVGLESGCNSVLEFVNKGAEAKDHILGGRNIKKSGISLCTYVMPGLGGKKWTKQHAEDTSYVINKIEPEYLRLRTLEIFPLTKLKKKQEAGKFTELSEEEIVKEERRLVENINCNTTITSDSAANLLIDVWGELPKDKNKILKIIDNYLDLDKEEKIEFSLKRRLEAYKSQYGGLSQVIQKKYNRLQELSDKGKLYQQEAQKLIKFIRSRLIP